MISPKTARRLKEAGLEWRPQLHDFFAIPDRNLDDRHFVLSDMTVVTEILHGRQAITFNGAVEWSLDFILKMEVIWLPTEAQLRTLLMGKLAGGEEPVLRLVSQLVGYTCHIRYQDRPHAFEADDPSEAYAAALLHILTHEQSQAPSA